ncbi:solute carrier family 25 member 44 [Chrysoperla carnea]|uniref:solute carrier family 25 member 44 n=1 Tax=Chrysoperla carnea TaxID=189513 RepID=UPI001D0902B3|nr:solute carrier family 25 member 44 [Chrysoperla carnea]
MEGSKVTDSIRSTTAPESIQSTTAAHNSIVKTNLVQDSIIRPTRAPDFPIIRSIEWEMMDKRKFFPLSMLSSFSIRCFLYPLTVVRTRLQLQKNHAFYSGTFDALTQIYQSEGPRGLYRGFWISSVQVFSGFFYISTFEGLRYICTQHGFDMRTKALIAGAAASVVGQTIIVPFDVISQHLMVLGACTKTKCEMNPLGIEINEKNRTLNFLLVCKKILQIDGIRGFYRGYTASLCSYVPNSALWWTFYQIYQDELFRIMPESMPQLVIQSIAGSFGGFTTTIITNPLDVVRARLQVQRIGTMRRAFKDLWHEEKLMMFTKGLSARLVQSAAFSFSIILGYETIKRISVTEEYKGFVRW